MEKKQTAVEWLEEIYLTIGIDRNVHFNQAKEMEKQQIVNAVDGFPLQNRHLDGEQYYNETFAS